MYINTGYLNHSHKDFKDKSRPLIVGSCGTYRLSQHPKMPTYRPRGRLDYQIIYISSGLVHFHFDNPENETIMVRFSEALCILPVFTPAAIPGLFIGCLISNLITGGIIWDIIFGSIATLLGALGTYFLRKKKFVYTLPPVIANIIIVPLVLRYGYGLTTIYKGVDISLLFNAVTVGIGEIISICVLGSLLKGILSKYRNVIFKQDEA